ncbi:GntR family transcriptional regulator, histidine utilization repressor [Cupriavidus metallidurans]|jgi:GntR family histidine utilization transcriptional repressor|uniref:Histidine utilization repressor n=1 Tax=Cupriavidus metallidurans TaxID=119219 RepID=A0A482ISS7_9BURK|nr:MULTISPECIES: histidine utilization repressor [Cupriavidus]PCH54025.1 MAG: histidine utilization repressor [Burkholderiaceae bacterium]KWR78738.1 histidine utilization repressor [Cupriavidus sp. SHE]MDE4919261.1 histidine utilization repressor [Cupriavidus metallidurans]QBP10932.1 histidine utilization repressor [Cupriavidus metallidurans]QWC87994.1 histidine utilization repressor [Cupriavidus metallidurans]
MNQSASQAPTPTNATAPAALYRQVKEYIARQIQSGVWKPGDRVPSEQELVNRFSVSRMTVNRALRELSEQGRVVRVAGVGTFVAEQKPQSTLLSVVNLQDEIRMRGHDYACDVILVERVSAPIEVAAALELHTGESVYHSVCVHREDGVPVQLEDRYVNPRVAPEFINQDFSGTKPGEYLLRNVPYDQVEHVVDAISATPEQAAQLEMPPTQPCLLLTRRTWTNGVPVTFVRCLHPGNRYRLGSRFRADGNPAFG